MEIGGKPGMHPPGGRIDVGNKEHFADYAGWGKDVDLWRRAGSNIDAKRAVATSRDRLSAILAAYCVEKDTIAGRGPKTMRNIARKGADGILCGFVATGTNESGRPA
jgi:hypothetical protein